jgi:poly(A) polymerase
MDALEVLDLCALGAQQGVPDDVQVPRIFGQGDYQNAWRRHPVQVRAILDALLTGPFPDAGLELLLRSGALAALIPELQALRDLGDDPEAALHKDVWDHTKKVVLGVPATVEMRWSALMHDVGKAQTRAVDRQGRVSFHNHDVVGARAVGSIERRLGLFGKDVALLRTVRSLVLNHLRPAGYSSGWTDSAVRRLLTDLDGMRGFERLLALSRADLTTKNPRKRAAAMRRGDELEARVRELYAADNLPRLPKGTMGIILARSGAAPGPWLGELKEQLEAAMAGGQLSSDLNAESYAAEGLLVLGLGKHAG